MMSYMNHVAKRSVERKQQQESEVKMDKFDRAISVEDAAQAKNVSLSQIRTALRNGQQQNPTDPWLNGVKERGEWKVIADAQWEAFGRKRAKKGSRKQEAVEVFGLPVVPMKTVAPERDRAAIPSLPTVMKSVSEKKSSKIDDYSGDRKLPAAPPEESEIVENTASEKSLTDFGPTKYQAAIFDWINNGKGNACVNAVAGSGKCLGKGTPILMYDGTVKAVEDVRPGDLLMGMDSIPRRVISTTTGRDQMFRVVPVKGNSWVCNSVHILTLVHSVTGEVFDVSLDEYLRKIGTRRMAEAKLLRVAVNFNSQEVPIDPYLAGLWIGDGTTGETSITSRKPEIIEYCESIASVYGCQLAKRWDEKNSTYTLRFRKGTREMNNRPHGLRRALLSKMHNKEGIKTIPAALVVNSRQVRLEFLAGWIDTDGYDAGGYCEIATKYEHLKDSLLFLARSLGFAAYAVRKTGTIKSSNFTGMYWRVTISGDLSVIPTRARKFAPRLQKKNVCRTGFAVDPIGEGEYYGFTLDGDGRFLLGDFTVTHNTTTILEAAKRLPEGQGGIFLAFNKSIATEIKNRLSASGIPPHRMEARTIHSIGLEMLRNHFGQVKAKIEDKKYTDIAKAMFPGETSTAVKNTWVKLVDLCRASTLETIDRDTILDLADHFGLDDVFPGNAEYFAAAVSSILNSGVNQAQNTGVIDYGDMIYLPVAWNLYAASELDWIMVDECQDLTKCQAQFVLECLCGDNTRVIAVGDPRQAIYGFAGADADSYPNLRQVLNAQEFPLSTCFRCPKSHIELAAKIVPQIEAKEAAVEGTIRDIAPATLYELIKPNDFILSRKTAPLITVFFALITQKIPAVVRGRDLGKSMVSSIKKIGKDCSFENLGDATRKHFADRIAKLDPEENQQKIQNLEDQRETILALYEHSQSRDIESFCVEVEAIFSDEENRGKVILCTVHRAKGLEAERVFVIRPEDLPLTWRKQKPWQYEQEQNLRYVALTRSKSELYFVKESVVETQQQDAHVLEWDNIKHLLCPKCGKRSLRDLCAECFGQKLRAEREQQQEEIEDPEHLPIEDRIEEMEAEEQSAQEQQPEPVEDWEKKHEEVDNLLNEPEPQGESAGDRLMRKMESFLDGLSGKGTRRSGGNDPEGVKGIVRLLFKQAAHDAWSRDQAEKKLAAALKEIERLNQQQPEVAELKKNLGSEIDRAVAAEVRCGELHEEIEKAEEEIAILKRLNEKLHGANKESAHNVTEKISAANKKISDIERRESRIDLLLDRMEELLLKTQAVQEENERLREEKAAAVKKAGELLMEREKLQQQVQQSKLAEAAAMATANQYWKELLKSMNGTPVVIDVVPVLDQSQQEEPGPRPNSPEDVGGLLGYKKRNQYALECDPEAMEAETKAAKKEVAPSTQGEPDLFEIAENQEAMRGKDHVI